MPRRIRVEKIILTEADVVKCMQFAETCALSNQSHYAKRKQGNLTKITEDIFTGKMGEIAAYRLLRQHGVKASQPDFVVYESKGKSFDADMIAEGCQFHCKSQSEASRSRFGESWILQYGGNGHGHTDKLFKNRDDSDYLIPMTVNDKVVTIYGVIKINTLFDNNMIEEPANPWFKGTKKALYWETMKKLSWKDRWGFLK